MTTAPGGDGAELRRDFKRLRRKIETQFGFEGLEYFALDTVEGNGVLHTVLAYAGGRSFYIPQAWLSDQWCELHGAFVVYVQKMGNTRKDQRCVSKYVATQYLADQKGAAVRTSYSWWRSRVALARAWETLKTLASHTYYDDSTGRRRWFREYILPMAEVIAAWESLLRDGWAMLGETYVEIRGRDVVEVF